MQPDDPLVLGDMQFSLRLLLGSGKFASGAVMMQAGCAGVTLYQECYDPARYREFHRWGPKRDFTQRLEAPTCALSGGIPSVGMGTLLGLADPYHAALALYRHVSRLQKEYWRSAFALSSPRLRPEVGINRMSAGSLTTVGGYEGSATSEGQFEVSDVRSVEAFCAMLRERGLEPVFKNWDAAYRSVVPQR